MPVTGLPPTIAPIYQHTANKSGFGDGPLYPETLDGRELEDWPQGLSVMLRIAHPTLEPYLLFAWRGSEHVQDHAVAYDWANATPDGKRALASYELHTLVHTNVFRAMHRVRFCGRGPCRLRHQARWRIWRGRHWSAGAGGQNKRRPGSETMSAR